MKMYGIFDTKDRVWLGDEHGPSRYDYDMAMAGATIVNEQFKAGYRFRAAPLPKDQTWRKHGDITSPITVEEAIKRVEGKCPKT